MVLRACTALLAVTVASLFATSCGGGDDAPDPTATPATTIARLTAAYGDPKLDPSAEGWQAILDDPEFSTKPVAFTEFVKLKQDDEARATYDEFVDALTPALTAVGGEMLSVNDILFPGLEGLEGYDGGVSWVATAPSLSAYIDAMLDPAVVAAAGSRRDATEEAQTLAGPNLLPEVILNLGDNAPASNFPSERVQGKTPQQIVDELLQVYPEGNADPTGETLLRIAELDGFADQRVHFINLYRFNDDPSGGQTALSEYNVKALPVVLAHGGRPKVLANVTHHLVGPTRWSRFIFVSWPSLAVFTDLRLDPIYLEAQESRVISGDEYGNLINIARADAPAPAP